MVGVRNHKIMEKKEERKNLTCFVFLAIVIADFIKYLP
jgi:hypothetical protein